MPRVRRYEDNLVALPQTAGARFAAADNDGGIGGALGAGLQQLGGVLSRHAEALAIREEHRARELEVASAHEFQQLQDAVRQTRGFAAEQAMAEAQQRVEAMRREVLTGAESAVMRNMLADVFNQRAEVARHEMEAHVEREKFASRLDLSTQRQALAQDDAVRAITPLGFQTNIRTAFDEIDAQGELMRVRSRRSRGLAKRTARRLPRVHSRISATTGMVSC